MQTIQTSAAPAAVGPYAQGVICNRFLFTAGQIPIVPSTGAVVEGGLAEQTRQVLANLDAVLLAAGTSWDKVVKTTVFLTDLNGFSVMNGIYSEHLGDARPARSTVQVAALPKDVMIEVELIAAVEK